MYSLHDIKHSKRYASNTTIHTLSIRSFRIIRDARYLRLCVLVRHRVARLHRNQLVFATSFSFAHTKKSRERSREKSQYITLNVLRRSIFLPAPNNSINRVCTTTMWSTRRRSKKKKRMSSVMSNWHRYCMHSGIRTHTLSHTSNAEHFVRKIAENTEAQHLKKRKINRH